MKAKKKRREEQEEEGGAKQKGMDSSKVWYESLVFLYGILRFCMVNDLSPNLGFC